MLADLSLFPHLGNYLERVGRRLQPRYGAGRRTVHVRSLSSKASNCAGSTGFLIQHKPRSPSNPCTAEPVSPVTTMALKSGPRISRTDETTCFPVPLPASWKSVMRRSRSPTSRVRSTASSREMAVVTRYPADLSKFPLLVSGLAMAVVLLARRTQTKA